MSEKYISLSSQTQVLNSLNLALKLKEKLILVIGKSGVGKSFLLQRFAKNSNYFFFTPAFFTQQNFLKALHELIFKERLFEKESFEDFKNLKQDLVIILDEAGMYDESLFEQIRVLSDLPRIYFILSMHKKQDFLNKEHFKSRISRELKLGFDFEDFAVYVREKFDIVFNTKDLKWLLGLSKFSLRTSDKMLETFKQIQAEYERENIHRTKRFILELCALHHKLWGNT